MTPLPYPETLEIVPLAQPPSASVYVPGSKSITNRAFVLAALSGSGCLLSGILLSEDISVMVVGLRQLGFEVIVDIIGGCSLVRRPANAGTIPASDAQLFVENSG